jgi:putative transposase
VNVAFGFFERTVSIIPAIQLRTKRLHPSLAVHVGGVGDTYDNALTESTIGLFKTEVIDFMGLWKPVAQVEWETLKWVNWHNTKCLHSKIGYITPHEAEENFYETLNAAEKAA